MESIASHRLLMFVEGTLTLKALIAICRLGGGDNQPGEVRTPGSR